MSLSQLGAEISAFEFETSGSISRKNTLWVLVFSTPKSMYFHGLSAQIFRISAIDPCQRPRVFA